MIHVRLKSLGRWRTGVGTHYPSTEDFHWQEHGVFSPENEKGNIHTDTVGRGDSSYPSTFIFSIKHEATLLAERGW